MPLASLRTLRTFPKALCFGGVVVVEDFTAFDPRHAITVIVWVYPGTEFCVLNRRSARKGNGVFNWWRSWMIGYRKLQLRFKFDISLWDPTTKEGTLYSIYTPNNSAEPGQWHFIALTWQPNLFKVWVNEDSYEINTTYPQIYYDADDPDATAADSRLFIGSFDGSSSPGQNFIATVLIYNHALNLTEIQHNYNNPLNPVTDGLVLWLDWTSIDIANGLWLDRSGNGNDGVIHGATEETILKNYARQLVRARTLSALR